MFQHLPSRRCFTLVLLLLLLNACSTFDYVPPTTDAGKQCVATCEVASQTCHAGELQASSMQRSMCESNKTSQLALCLSDAKTDDKRKDCRQQAKSECAYSVPYGVGSCSASYDRCFTTCGGKIIERPD